MTFVAAAFYSDNPQWEEISRREQIDETGRLFYSITYQTSPQFKLGIGWRIARVIAACFLCLSVIPALVFRKYTLYLFQTGLSGIEQKTVRVAKNVSDTLESEISPPPSPIDPGLVHVVPSLSSSPSLEIIPSDFSQLAELMSPEASDADFLVILLSRLQENATLKELFSKDASVSEGYTVLEHTRLVLETAQKWRNLLEAKVLPLASWKEFLLFLALHDIGKGSAKESQSATFGTCITFKERELKNTRHVLRQVMERLGIEPKKITLFSTLLTYDTQGLYLRQFISKEEAFDNLIEMACTAQVPLHPMYDLLEVFHTVDAASYPGLFSSIFSVKDATLIHSPENQKLIDDLRELIHLADKGQEVLTALVQETKTGGIGVRLAKESKKLFTYLRVVHRTMLMDPSGDKELYRQVKRGFRDILIAVGKESGKDTFPTLYQQVLYKTGGRREMDCLGSITLNTLFCSREAAYEEENDFSALIDELINFRKDYLVRHSKEKVARFLAQEKEALRRPCAAAEEEPYSIKQLRDKIASLQTDNPDSFNLLPLTFIHGSNSAIMSNLLLTDMQLIPTGRLFNMGIVPLSGELQNGSTSQGVNHDKISGTALDNGERALSYAETTSFHTTFQGEKDKLNDFIEKMTLRMKSEKSLYQTEDDTTETSWYARVRVSILRLRVFDQEAFNTLEPRLHQIVLRMERDFKAFKKTEGYKHNMPKKEDPTQKLQYQWHDYYWFSHFKRTEDGIQSLKKAMTDSLFVPQGVQEAVTQIFPLTFGSTTLNPLTIEPNNPSERCSVTALKLGKDLQYIFAHRNDKEKVTSYLQGQGIGDSVKVMDKADLEDAILLNRIAAPYFCDIASRKKIQSLSLAGFDLSASDKTQIGVAD